MLAWNKVASLRYIQVWDLLKVEIFLVLQVRSVSNAKQSLLQV